MPAGEHEIRYVDPRYHDVVTTVTIIDADLMTIKALDARGITTMPAASLASRVT